jgi:hypothetical protein
MRPMRPFGGVSEEGWLTNKQRQNRLYSGGQKRLYENVSFLNSGQP